MAKTTNNNSILSKGNLDSIAEFMQNNPSVQSVHFNDEGKWHFSPQSGCENSMSRAEVLEGETPVIEETPKDKGNK